MDHVNWGVLSTARIGVEKVIPAMQQCQSGSITGLASRSLDNAQALAAQLNIERSYGSYEAMLADPDIHAVYNPLPNHLHVPWTIKAIEAGKHVLCEKPIALDVQEAMQLQQAMQQYPDVKVMEAFMYRFHPQWQKALELVKSGAIGELRTIQTFFSYFNDDPSNIRNSAEMGGGGLMDIGCYPVSVARYLYGREPQRIIATLDIDPRFGIDRTASAIMDFGGPTASFSCSMQLSPYQRTQIVGTSGRIDIEIPFNAPPDAPTRLWLFTGSGREETVFPPCDQYTLQADAFSAAVITDSIVPTPLSDAIDNMRVIDAAVASHKTGDWVTI